jgi:hypothetical protein
MTNIVLEGLTNAAETGVFDKLSLVVRKQLEEEFSAGRLTGTEYSKVYVSTIEATLNQSINFLLQKDISANQADLLAAQRVLTLAQEAAVQKDMLLTDAQIVKLNREIILLDKQEDLMDSQIALSNAQVIKANIEGDVLLKEKDKLTQEIQLVIAKTAESAKQVEILTAQALNIPKEGALLDKQVNKMQAEIEFTDQKVKSEIAQIVDQVDSVPVAGVIGAQKSLYLAQAAGFILKPKQDMLANMLDVWKIAKTADEAIEANYNNHLSDLDIGLVVAANMASIGLTPAIAPPPETGP